MTKGVLLIALLLYLNYVVQSAAESHYINEWAAHIPGGSDRAKRVALDHGYEVIHKVRGFDDHYILRHKDVPHHSKRSADHHTQRLTTDKRVAWVEQQVARSRSKRDLLEDKRSEDRAYRDISFNDPQWPKQWYLQDMRTNLMESKKDLHVIPLWNRNLTGAGVVITVLDDGVERTHDDLAPNYDPEASYDVNGHDDDPMPRYDPTNENKHGTRCAGEIAMVANNGKCGVGIAYNAKIGGVRMLDGVVTDMLEGEAMAFNVEHVDIYSASWGPNDDGVTVEGPGPKAREAFEKGIKKGRGGKGSLYVWASGNGGRMRDNCDCDGYTGSIYSLSISSASEHFDVPWYAERCASTMATTYSSGNLKEQRVVSSDLHNTCTDKHTGTSAAAPMAAGIFALLLESNPSLTWRDVQHLVAWTSQYDPLKTNDGWIKNGAGFFVNTAFGFGLLDATGLVDAANPAIWRTVPEQRVCRVKSDNNSGLPARLSGPIGKRMAAIEITTDACAGEGAEINFLEHVILEMTIEYTKRGALEVFLVSPSNTRTTLLSARPHDRSELGFKEWPLMSVHNWGEKARGKWRVEIYDKSKDANTGLVKEVSLLLHGTREKPHHMKSGPRKYVKYNLVTDEKKVIMELLINNGAKEETSSRLKDLTRLALAGQVMKSLREKYALQQALAKML